MLTINKYYTVEIAGITRQLPLLELDSGVRIAVFNVLGDTELVEAVATALTDKLRSFGADLLITPESKSIALAHAMAVRLSLRYVVLRKHFRSYMGDTLQAQTHSITTGNPQTLYLDEKDRSLMQGKKVIIVDDVISTGSTLQGMRNIINEAGAQVLAISAVFTEGNNPSATRDVVALGHLPLFNK